jgi:hypothetical protein
MMTRIGEFVRKRPDEVTWPRQIGRPGPLNEERIKPVTGGRRRQLVKNTANAALKYTESLA